MSHDVTIGFVDLAKLPIPPRYRVMIVEADGRVVHAERLPACDDHDALQQAEALVDGRAVELWDGLRFIERFDATMPALGPRPPRR